METAAHFTPERSLEMLRQTQNTVHLRSAHVFRASSGRSKLNKGD